MSAPLKVLVAGLGNMGRSHALACHRDPRFEIVGLVNRSAPDLPPELRTYPLAQDFHAALERTRPDLAVIATYTESHAEYAIAAMRAGAHVFVEKPLAPNMDDARKVVATARETGRKLVVGYILRVHPSWQRLIAEARALGGPFVFRLNLNQQSTGPQWEVHKALMRATSPIVDCGVHYVDVMCQITDAAPMEVRGMGLRLSEEIAPEMYNYGHFQILFEDGSVGWYEAGWGPMISETAYFVKDVIAPSGAVSIVGAERDGGSSEIEGHTRVGALRLHRAGAADQLLELPDEPDHQALCDAELALVADAILNDRDLERHMRDALTSLAVCLGADESIRTGRAVTLQREV